MYVTRGPAAGRTLAYDTECRRGIVGAKERARKSSCHCATRFHCRTVGPLNCQQRMRSMTVTMQFNFLAATYAIQFPLSLLHPASASPSHCPFSRPPPSNSSQTHELPQPANSISCSSKTQISHSIQASRFSSFHPSSWRLTGWSVSHLLHPSPSSGGGSYPSPTHISHTTNSRPVVSPEIFLTWSLS